jgi:Ca-activated chloride channel family protein
MYADDTPPSRIELAKRKMIDLVKSLSATGVARFGITVFSGDGYTVCPVTTDHGVLNQFIELISPELVTTLGSNLAAGLETALGRLDDAAKRATRVILISDGEDNFINYAALAREIASKGVRIDTLGVGTPNGTRILLPNGAQVTDASRSPVISTLHEDSLKKIAEAGGGRYIRASLDDSDVIALSQATLSKIGHDQLLNPEHKGEVTTFREFGALLALGALIALTLCAASPRANPLLTLLLLCGYALSPAHAQPQSERSERLKNPLISQETSPYSRYRAGDFSGAAEIYRDALKRSPNDRNLLHGLASALFKQGKYQESYELFQRLTETATDGRSFFEGAYNQGNALLKLNRYNDAIDSYSRALDLKPDDEMALHNRDVARALLEQAQNATPTPTPTHTPTPTPNPQQSSTSESTPSPTPAQQGSPSSSPEPTQNPDQQRDQSDTTPTAAATPSPAADPSPSEDNRSTPQPTALATVTAQATISSTASAAVTAAVTAQASPTQSQRLKEALEPSPSPAHDYTSAISPTPQIDDNTALPEADAWLESLPDSPLLVRRHRGSSQNNGQTW